MNKTNNLFLLISILVTILSCTSIKDGLSSNKNNTDEFLVEKKAPLVMPPEFNELPIPGNVNQEQKNDENSEIKSLITGSENKSSKSQNNSNQNSTFENSILEKIKNN